MQQKQQQGFMIDRALSLAAFCVASRQICGAAAAEQLREQINYYLRHRHVDIERYCQIIFWVAEACGADPQTQQEARFETLITRWQNSLNQAYYSGLLAEFRLGVLMQFLGWFHASEPDDPALIEVVNNYLDGRYDACDQVAQFWVTEIRAVQQANPTVVDRSSLLGRYQESLLCARQQWRNQQAA